MTERQPECQIGRISRLLMPDAVDSLDQDITDLGDGEFEVDHALFATREAALRYCINRAVLDEHLRELTLIEERTERMLAARDAMRAQVPEMVASLAREQVGAAAGEHEHELALSTLAVEQRTVYEAEVVAQARGKTPAQLRHLTRRIVNRLASAPEAVGAAAACQDRAVWIEQQSDGMAHFTIKTTTTR